MNIKLIVVSKTDVPYLQTGIDEYIGRLKHYCDFELVVIPALKNGGRMSPEEVKSKEGELILGNLVPSDMVILLDEHGKEHSSVEFARQIESWTASSGKNIVFVIGGAYGFSDAVYSRSNGKLSLSRMTFSHQMVRAIFAEQLYRAFTIIKGQPYHHE